MAALSLLQFQKAVQDFQVTDREGRDPGSEKLELAPTEQVHS